MKKWKFLDINPTKNRVTQNVGGLGVGVSGGFSDRVGERLRERLENSSRWATPFHAVLVILNEITGGVGPWGAIRPLIATG